MFDDCLNQRMSSADLESLEMIENVRYYNLQQIVVIDFN